MRWTPVEPPPEGIRFLAWFKDAFYGLGFRPDGGSPMYRSSDGSVWEEVPSFVSALPDAIEVHRGVVAGGDRLIVLGSEPQQSGWGSPRCSVSSGGLIVAVSSDGTTWTISEVTAKLPTPPSDAVCVSFYPGSVATGPAGILVSASISVEIDYEGIIADELGDNVLVTFLQHTGDRLVFQTLDGQDYELSLSELGYTQDDLAPPQSGAIAWWSPDGVTWQQVADEWPMITPSLGSIAAVDDGFLVTRAGIGLWKTTDGSSWETIDQKFSNVILDWAGTPVQFNWQRGELKFFGDDTVLPMSDGFDAVEIVEIGLGKAGILAVVSPSGSMETMEAMDAFWRSSGSALVYSPDGTVWRRWTPEEFDHFNKHDAVVVVGADRILVLTRDEAGSFAWIGVPET